MLGTRVTEEDKASFLPSIFRLMGDKDKAVADYAGQGLQKYREQGQHIRTNLHQTSEYQGKI